MYIQDKYGGKMWESYLNVDYNFLYFLTQFSFQEKSTIAGKAQEVFSSIKTVHLFNQHQQEVKIYKSNIGSLAAKKRKILILDSISEAFSTLAINICIVIGLWYGGTYVKYIFTSNEFRLVINKEMSSGDLITYTLFAIPLNSHLGNLPSLLSKVLKVTIKFYFYLNCI